MRPALGQIENHRLDSFTIHGSTPERRDTHFDNYPGCGGRSNSRHKSIYYYFVIVFFNAKEGYSSIFTPKQFYNYVSASTCICVKNSNTR